MPVVGLGPRWVVDNPTKAAAGLGDRRDKGKVSRFKKALEVGFWNVPIIGASAKLPKRRRDLDHRVETTHAPPVAPPDG